MTVQHVQTKREIEALLSTAGLRPRRRLGQHFLIDGNLMRRLAGCAELTAGDTVLEVGGGTGGLTDLLVTQAARIICVEMDAGLYALLRERFSNSPRLTLLPGDILQSKHRIREDVAALIRETDSQIGAVKLVANLPYQVATPLLMNLLENFPEVRRCCFSVQAEVGERIISAPKRKSFGPLSLLSQLLCRIEIVAHLPAHVFWPAPAVDSVMLRMDVKEPAPLDRPALHRFSTLIRKTFEHRRKTLRSALGYVVADRVRDASLAGFDLSLRPEALGVEEWTELFFALDVLSEAHAPRRS